MTKHALLAGASGLVGNRCLARLLAHDAYDRVTVLVRRSLELTHEKLHVVLANFDALEPIPGHIDDVFCCLGTTIKSAGSQEAFRRVDHDYPVALATVARASGARQFLLVSALGADAASKVFYSRIKGETEKAIVDSGISKVIFLRPSLLLGHRRENRPGEKLGIVVGRLIAPMLLGPLRKYRPVRADDVAAAMLYAANHEVASGPIDSDEIVKLARRENAGE